MKQIKKYPAYFITKDGAVFSSKTNKYLKPSIDKQGYKKVGFYIGNYRNKSIKVHRLVAEAFIENPLNKTDVNHKNGIKSDNRVENLEWSTRSENIKHAFENGLSKISEKQRERFIKMLKSNTGGKNPASRKVINIETGVIHDTVNEVVAILGVKRTTLQAMLSGQNKNKTNYKFYE